MRDIQLELMREKYADHLQAEFYKNEAGLNEIWELYMAEHCLSDEEGEECYKVFALEHVAGISDRSGTTHKIVSDLAWKRAQTCRDLNFLQSHFGTESNP